MFNGDIFFWASREYQWPFWWKIGHLDHLPLVHIAKYLDNFIGSLGVPLKKNTKYGI